MTTTGPPSNVAAFTLSAGGYVLAGPILILLNNRILNEAGFPYPIALSALGAAFAALASRIMLLSGALPFSQHSAIYTTHGSTLWHFYFTRALPVGALTALTLGLGNAAYVHLSVAMCQMLKALTPAMTFLLLLALRIETPTHSEALCVLVITFGTLVATRGELTLSTVGVLIQLGANAAESFRLVLSQQLLANMKLPLFEMQYHVAPPQLLCLLVRTSCLPRASHDAACRTHTFATYALGPVSASPLTGSVLSLLLTQLASALFEMRTASDRAVAAAALWANPLLFAMAGALGLLLQVVGLIAVKATGSVTFKLLGIARGAALVLFEVCTGATSRTPPTTVQLVGYTTSLAGFGLYTMVRLRGRSSGSPPAEVEGNGKPKAQ